MKRICQTCHKTYSSRQPLWNHKKYCKGETKHHSFLARSQNQQPSLVEKKPVNPKISALIDAIIDEEPSSKYLPKDKPTTSLESLSIPPAPKKKKKTLPINKLFPVKKTPPRVDLSAKVDDDDDITDTDTDDDDIDNLHLLNKMWDRRI